MAIPQTVLVRVGADALEADVRAGRHTFVLDEPVEVGGQDLGPTPYDMLLSALGACTAITLRLYANRKAWPLEVVEVRLRHQRVHLTDCAACEQPDQTLDHVQKDLRLLGALTDEQRQRLLEVSKKCPVQKMLAAALHITTNLLAANAEFAVV